MAVLFAIWMREAPPSNTVLPASGTAEEGLHNFV
jgi:hypothetical protein